MTGPEHYREAERLIAVITKAGALLPQSRILQPGDHGDVLAWAQVHATLALAASNVDLFAPAAATAQAWREAVAS